MGGGKKNNRFADDNNFYELQMASDEYVRKNFFQICNHPRLGVLTKRQVVRFINNLNQLIVDSEQQASIFDGINFFSLILLIVNNIIILIGVQCSYDLD